MCGTTFFSRLICCACLRVVAAVAPAAAVLAVLKVISCVGREVRQASKWAHTHTLLEVLDTAGLAADPFALPAWQVAWRGGRDRGNQSRRASGGQPSFGET